MFKSTTGALVLLLAAVSAAPQPDGDPPPPSSVIKQAFYIFPPPPKGGGAVAGGRGRFGCDNPHPYCKKDNHPKEACTDWGEAWKGWVEENCPEKCGKCGGGGGPPPGPPGRDDGNDSNFDPITNIGVNQTELLELGIKLIEGDEVQEVGDSEDLDENGDYTETWIPRQRWTDRVVPYEYTDANSFGPKDRRVIEGALASLNRKLGSSCLQFRPRRSNEENYIGIVRKSGCFSSVGMVGGRQALSLGHGCVYTGIVQHEFLHALGILHEQSRGDRDNYIYIYKENISPNMLFNFGKYNTTSQYGQSVPYNYNSIMHYGSEAFSKNGKPTILKKNMERIYANRKEITEKDLKKIRIMYRCSGGGGEGVATTVIPNVDSDDLNSAYDEINPDDLNSAYDEINPDDLNCAYDEINPYDLNSAYDEINSDDLNSAYDEINPD